MNQQKRTKESFNNLTHQERAAILAKGRVTVGKITQIVDRKMVSFYVGKLAGHIVGDLDNYKSLTKEKARERAIDFRTHCREIIQKNITG